jgi:hypothetical protein
MDPTLHCKAIHNTNIIMSGKVLVNISARLQGGAPETNLTKLPCFERLDSDWTLSGNIKPEPAASSSSLVVQIGSSFTVVVHSIAVHSCAAVLGRQNHRIQPQHRHGTGRFCSAG